MEEARSRGKGILSTALALMQSKDNINIRHIRLHYLQYMLIFPLAPVFANMQRALFSDAVSILGLDAMTLLGSAYCLGAGALFAATNTKNMASVAKLLAIVTATAFLVWLMLPESILSLYMAIAFIFALGGCAACASFAYTFVLNNPERLLGAAAISLFFSLHQLDSGLSLLSGLFDKAYLASLVLGTCLCLLAYKREDFSVVEQNKAEKMNVPIKLMLYFFVAHYFVEIFYTYLPGASSSAAMVANGAVGILVVCLAIAFQLITKYGIWNMCNLFFIAMILTYGLYFLPEGSYLRSLARYLHGFEQIGYIAAYYLLGCVFKKYGGFRTFKLALVTILPLSMVSYLLPGAIAVHAPAQLPLIAALVSSAVFIGFIFMSPAYAKHLFADGCVDDFQRVDMEIDGEEIPLGERLESFDLTPREEEIAILLLEGRSAKQIAMQLGISAHTVNFHVRNLYQKLGVNSRASFFSRLR